MNISTDFAQKPHNTRQHNGHSPWCRVYKQVRCCPLPMSEKPDSNYESPRAPTPWVHDVGVFLEPHHPVPLACLDVRELLLHRSHDSSSRAHPGHLKHVSASMTLWPLWKTVEPGKGTERCSLNVIPCENSHTKLLVKLQVLVRVAFEVFFVGTPLFLWQCRHMPR